jgi:phosphate transport system substrate-binding protein
MKSQAKALFGALLGAAVLLGTSSAGAADDRLVLTGSSTVAPLVGEIGKRFEKLNPGVRVDVQSGGSTRGVNDARSGLADIGMASRSLNPDEQNLKSYAIARDGIGIILHKSNPVASLSNEQIIAIYTGDIRNWREVGGKDAKITVVNKAEGRSTLELFLHYFPGAIGYVSIGTAEFEEAQGTPIRQLPLDGVAATVANVRNGSFPLARPLNLVTTGKESALARRFIDYARSEAVHDLVTEQYFVPLAR